MNAVQIQYLFLLILLYSGLSNAACSPVATTATVNISGTITVPRALTPGQPVGSVYGPFSGSGASLGNCGFQPYFFLAYNSTMTDSIFSDVYKTNISGIGVKIWTTFLKTTVVGNTPTYWYQHNQSAGVAWITGVYLQFYKLDENPSEGVINFPNPLIRAQTSSKTSSPDGLNYNFLAISSSLKIQTEKGCSIVTFDKEVLLPDVKKSELIVSAGRYATGKDFSIELSCTPQTKVSIKLDGSVMPGKTDVLANLSAGGNSAKSSVGIQVLYNKNPVNFQQQLLLINSAGVSQSLPFTAYYYYNGGDDIQAGDVTSTSTFTLTYQ